ncbi:hypothetical protein GQ54DRAFT_261947 [Martensiomyces pterosporus]|nr:hypothetical protein GQ54DRAFT_261947 [Martensiomyces pterosporus]
MRSSPLIVVLGTTVLASAVLVVNGAYLLAEGGPPQIRGIGSIVEAVLLLLSALFTLWVLVRESTLEAYELDRRLRAISQEICCWNGTYADLRTAQLPTVTTYWVLRDGVWRDVPTLLLVEGDVIALGYGEAVPCSVAIWTKAKDTNEDYVLVRGQKFTPDIMRTWVTRPWDPESIGHRQMAGRVLFSVLDTPLSSHLEQISLHHRRSSRSVLQNQIRIVVRLCVLRILPVVAGVALIANLIIFGVVDVGQASQHRMAIEAVLSKTVYVVFPFACTVLWPVFWIAARVFTSSCEVVLFDTLQRSKTDYEDMEDIDEFDVEALPPTKDVTVAIGAILGRMRWLWSNCDYRNLSRSSNLSETLGSITVICSIDKEGTIAEPFCSPEQVVVPDKDDEYAILDFAEQQIGTERSMFIIDDGWEKYLPSLRPLGLSCCLNTSAHQFGKGRLDSTHRRQNCMHHHGKTLPAQSTCYCKIARAIGFEAEDLAEFHKLKEANVFAPFHQSTDSTNKKGILCAASFTSAVFQTDGGPGKLQMMSDGSVELVLSMCLDYFDGSGIQPLDDRIMSTYYGLYLNALQQDLQCIAFSYRPLALDAKGMSRGSDDMQAANATTLQEGGGGGPNQSADSQYSDSLENEMLSEQDAMGDLPEYLSEESRKAALRSRARYRHPALFDDNAEFDYSKAALELFSTQEGFFRDAVAEQVFLGLVTFAYDPKTDVCDFIEDLSIAGIRFVYFSRSKGRQSKAFAERLGLETDWNTCILLSSAADDMRDSEGYVEDHDIKARLPRGIENIRSHLEEVDDIPLQISLFAECTPDATREMISIFQENGDVACCMGSALRDSNTLTFAAADLAVGVEPIPHFNRLYALGAALTCIPCPLFLQHDTSLYTLMQVIREARRLMNCLQQCAILLLLSGLALVVVNLVTSLCLLPPALSGYLMLWVLWIVAPLLGLSLLFVPHDENIMSTMPVKNQAHLSDMPRLAVYAVIRMLPPIVLTIFVYVTSLEKLLPDVSHLGELSSVFDKKDWLGLDHEQQWAVVAAQVYAMVAFVFHCVCVSSTLMYRTKTWLEFIPFRNIIWVGCSLICLVLTFAFAILLLAFGSAHVDRVSWYTYFVAFVGPLALLPLQDLCKLHDKKRWTRLQKLAKLEFNTKLGLHSPL